MLIIVAAVVSIAVAAALFTLSTPRGLRLGVDILVAAMRAEQEHEEWCPRAPAVVPVWAVSPSATAPAQRPVVHHPPVECELDGCEVDVWISTRENRSKKHRVFCSAAHKAAEAYPERRPKGPAFTPGRCPRPEKKAFDTAEACGEEFRTLLAADGSLEVYQCRCRRWHAGHPGVDDAMRIGAIATIKGDLT